MKKLYMYFLNEEGKRVSFSPAFAAQDLTAEQVQTAMEEIIELAAFESNGLKKYVSIVGAKYIETTTTNLI